MGKSDMHFHFKSLLWGIYINVIISILINLSLISCHSAYMSNFTSMRAIILNQNQNLFDALGDLNHHYIWKAFWLTNSHKGNIDVCHQHLKKIKASHGVSDLKSPFKGTD